MRPAGLLEFWLMSELWRQSWDKRETPTRSEALRVLEEPPCGFAGVPRAGCTDRLQGQEVRAQAARRERQGVRRLLSLSSAKRQTHGESAVNGTPFCMERVFSAIPSVFRALSNLDQKHLRRERGRRECSPRLAPGP